MRSKPYYIKLYRLLEHYLILNLLYFLFRKGLFLGVFRTVRRVVRLGVDAYLRGPA